MFHYGRDLRGQFYWMGAGIEGDDVASLEDARCAAEDSWQRAALEQVSLYLDVPA